MQGLERPSVAELHQTCGEQRCQLGKECLGCWSAGVPPPCTVLMESQPGEVTHSDAHQHEALKGLPGHLLVSPASSPEPVLPPVLLGEALPSVFVPHSVPRVSTLSFPPAALPSLPPPRGRLLVLQQQPTCGASGTQKQGLAPGGTEGSNEWVSGCVGKGTSGVPALQEPLAPGPHTLSDWRPSLPCHPCSTTASRAPHPRRRPPAAGRRPVCSHLCDPLSSSPHV